MKIPRQTSKVTKYDLLFSFTWEGWNIAGEYFLERARFAERSKPLLELAKQVLNKENTSG